MKYAKRIQGLADRVEHFEKAKLTSRQKREFNRPGALKGGPVRVLYDYRRGVGAQRSRESAR